MPLFLMGCFPVVFQEAKRPLRTKSGKRPIKVGKRPINEGKRPIKAMVLAGVAVGCLMGCFSGTPAIAENGPSKKAHYEVYDLWVLLILQHSESHRSWLFEGRQRFGHLSTFVTAYKPWKS